MKNTTITENHLYQKAYRKGKCSPGKYVIVYVLKDYANAKFVKADLCHRPLNRTGLTVGKKTGGAVDRVRSKRLIREAYRLIEKEYGTDFSHGWLIVMAAHGDIPKAKMQDVKKDLERSFRRLELLPKNGPAGTKTVPIEPVSAGTTD